MIDYIEIKGFKSIREARVNLAPINILIGSNGSGKSNFISFFEFLKQMYDRKLKEYVALRGGTDKFLFKGQKITPSCSFKMEFDEGENGYSVELEAGVEGFVITQEDLLYKGDPKTIGWSTNESEITLTDNFRARYVKKYLTGLRKYHFHDTGMNSPFTQYSHIENDVYFLYGDGKNLAAFLYHIKNRQKIIYQRIVKTIRSIAPFFSDFYFSPNENHFVRLQWTDLYSDTIFGASDLSDGTLRFVALCTLFLQTNLPDTLIIDEPELGLHPAAIRKLAGMIQSAAAKGCQVILATQSTDLISHFTPEDIITVDQIRGESVFNRLDSDRLSHWLEEYSIDDLWKRDIISGGQPNYNL